MALDPRKTVIIFDFSYLNRFFIREQSKNKISDPSKEDDQSIVNKLKRWIECCSETSFIFYQSQPQLSHLMEIVKDSFKQGDKDLSLNSICSQLSENCKQLTGLQTLLFSIGEDKINIKEVTAVTNEPQFWSQNFKEYLEFTQQSKEEKSKCSISFKVVDFFSISSRLDNLAIKQSCERENCQFDNLSSISNTQSQASTNISSSNQINKKKLNNQMEMNFRKFSSNDIFKESTKNFIQKIFNSKENNFRNKLECGGVIKDIQNLFYQHIGKELKRDSTLKSDEEI